MTVPVLPPLRARRLNVAGQRLYQVEGALYPSVTTILAVVAKPNLAAWARRTTLAAVREMLEDGLDIDQALTLAAEEPERARDAAASRGTAIHEAIAAALAGGPYPPGAEPYVRAALGFLRESGLSLVAHEAVILSRRYGFAGTCDVATAASDGGLVLVDWKTGGIWPEAALQLGAYSLALEEMTGRPVTEAFVVGLRHDGYEARAVNLSAARDGFLGALALWRSLRAGLLIGPEGQEKGQKTAPNWQEKRHLRTTPGALRHRHSLERGPSVNGRP